MENKFIVGLTKADAQVSTSETGKKSTKQVFSSQVDEFYQNLQEQPNTKGEQLKKLAPVDLGDLDRLCKTLELQYGAAVKRGFSKKEDVATKLVSEVIHNIKIIKNITVTTGVLDDNSYRSRSSKNLYPMLVERLGKIEIGKFTGQLEGYSSVASSTSNTVQSAKNTLKMNDLSDQEVRILPQKLDKMRKAINNLLVNLDTLDTIASTKNDGSNDSEKIKAVHQKIINNYPVLLSWRASIDDARKVRVAEEQEAKSQNNLFNDLSSAAKARIGS